MIIDKKQQRQRGCRENGTLVHGWWGCNLVQPLWKTTWRFFKKLAIEVPYDPATSLLGIYTKNMKTLICKDIYSPMFIAAFKISRIVYSII